MPVINGCLFIGESAILLSSGLMVGNNGRGYWLTSPSISPQNKARQS